MLDSINPGEKGILTDQEVGSCFIGSLTQITVGTKTTSIAYEPGSDRRQTVIISTFLGALIVSGREDDFEESWIIDVPPDVPDHDRWSVVCTSTGELFGRPAL